jgi:hypothetical protein
LRTYSDLPVYKASYDLLLLVYEFSNLLSRDYKYTIGERLKSETLELLTSNNNLVFSISKNKTDRRIREYVLAREFKIRLRK